MLIPRGPSDARLMIVTECVSYRDIQSNTILNDREFDRILSDASVDRNKCFVTALIRGPIQSQTFDYQVALSKKAITPDHIPYHNRYVKKGLIPYAEALARDIDLVKPKVILALGNGALFVLTGKWGIKSWRSSLLEYTSPNGHKCIIIPTYSPSFVQSVWKERNTVIHDVRKAAGIAFSDTPIVKPEYNFLLEPNFGSVNKVLDDLTARVEKGPTRLSVDIETRGGHITCVGIAWSSLDAICIPFIRAVYAEHPNYKNLIHYWMEEEEAFIVYRLYKLLTHPNAEVIGQNFLYDAQYFYRWFHFVPNFKRDTMLAQHTMFSSMPKGLDVLSALYCTYHVQWKDMYKEAVKKEA